MKVVSIDSVESGPKPLYRYPGKVPISVSNLGSRTKPLVEFGLQNAAKHHGVTFDDSRDNKSVASASDHMAALNRYRVRKTSYDQALLNKCIRYARRAFAGGHELEPIHLEDELKSAIKLEKSSGIPMFTSKAEAWDHDFYVFQKYLRSDLRFRPYPCVGYCRVQHGDKGPKTRLVWGYPQAMTIMEAQFAYPLSQSLLAYTTPYCFGLHKAELMARCQSIANANFRVGLDFSGFDATISPKLISAAFGILRSWFRPFTQMEELSWNRIVWYFIHTPILMPDGVVYQKHVGVPSGSFFTQMVDSIVNFIVLQYIRYRATSHFSRVENVLVLGDDSLCTWPNYPSVAKLEKFAEELGMVLNGKKSHVTRFGEGFDFLGHHWRSALPHRGVRELAKRAIYPERRSGIDDSRLRQSTRVVSLAGDAVEGSSLLSLFVRGQLWGGPSIAALNGRFRVAPEFIETGWSRGQDSALRWTAPSAGRDYLLQSLLL